MGSSANLINWPFASMIIGFVTGALSAFGYTHIGPFLKAKIGLHDTCGVHNLHAMPGLLGGIVSAIVSNKRTIWMYGDRYDSVFLRGSAGRTPA